MARYRRETIRDECFDARVAQVAVNSASLGQWELTRALLHSIGSADLRGDAKRTLEAFLTNPIAFWSPTVATASPHHLQWFALEQLCNACTPTEGEGAGRGEALRFVRDLVEFRLLLYRAHQLQHCQQQVAAALCQYHDAIALADRSGASLKHVAALPACSVNFLKTILTLNPSLGHALIAMLTSGASPELINTSKNLQKLFVDVILSILDELGKLKAQTASASNEPTEEPGVPLSTEGLSVEERELEVECQKRVADVVDAKMETVLDILSFINPNFAPKDKTLDTLFIHLLNFCFSFGPHLGGFKVFHPGKLYSCLLGQKSTALVVKLQDCEEILRQKYASKNQPDAHAVVLNANPVERCREKWKETVFEAVRGKRHFLEDKVEQGLSMIQAGNLQGLSDLLSPLELSPLKPLLLLLGWDRYPDHTTRRELLEVLWPPNPCPQPDLYSACWRLAYQVQLVEWCLQKVQLTLPLPGSGVPLTQLTKASEMFQGLESHSVLYVLYHSTPLGQLDPEEVVEVLGTSPYIASHLPTMGAGQTPPLLSPFGTPLRQSSRPSSPDTLSVSQYLTPPPVPPLSERSLKPTQERDISLYHAFCAIKAVSDAVNAKNETEGHQVKDENPPHKPKVRKKKLDYGVSEANAEAEDDQELARPLDVSARRKSAGSAIVTPSTSLSKQSEGLSPSQLLSVPPLVQKVKHHLTLVRPVTFQLEVMEDIFSLIFLQKSDKSAAEGETFSPTGLPTLPQLSVATDQFLASNETVQAILNILQDCLKPLSEEIRKIPRRAASQGAISFGRDISTAAPQRSAEVEFGAIDMLVDSSIGVSQLKQRLMSLKQHISEAVWRLQLVNQQGESEAVLKDMARNVSPQLLSTDSEEETAPVMTSDSSCGSDNADTQVKASDSVRTLQRKFSMHNGQKRKRAVRRVKSLVVRGSPSLREADWSSVPQTTLLSLPTSMSTPKPSSRGSPMPGLSRSVSLHSSFRRSTRGNLAKEAKKTDQDSGKEGDVEETHIPLSRQESKRRKRKSCKGSGASTPIILKSSRKHSHEVGRQSVVSRMLASPGSLLRSCIFHGNYVRANEVLKLKMATGQFGKTLVQFMESYPKVSQQLVRESRQWHAQSGPMSQSSRGAPSAGVDSVSGSSTAFSTTIQLAIFAASSVLVPMEGLHKLLALPALNDILYFGDGELESAAKSSPFVCGLDKCVSGLIVLDLTCCSAVSSQLVQRLIWMAQQCFRVGLSALESHSSAAQEQMTASEPPVLLAAKPSLESTWEAKSTVGPASLLRKLASFVANKVFQDEGEKHVQAPYDLFRNSLLSFDVDYCMAWSRFFKQYCAARREIDLSLKSIKSPGAMGYNDEDPSSNYPETLKTLMAVLDEQPHLVNSREQGTEQTVAASQSSVTKGGPTNLLSRFNLYLSRLAAIVVQSDKESAPSDSLLQLLNELPSTLVGRLLFERDVFPSHLKESLHSLGINVIEVALQCCCSTLTVKSGETGKGGTGGVIPLNSAGSRVQADGNECWKHPDPCQLSYELLTHIVQVLRGKESWSGLKELRDLGSDSAVQDAFRNAQQFQNVDLTLLDTSEKKTCFYSNVTNMAYLHALVWYAALGTTLEEQLGVSTEYLQLAQSVGTGVLDVFSHFGLTSHCGYTIGQLGTVSCIYLHQTVLLMGADHPKVADGCSLPFFTHLSPADPLRAYFPDTVDRRVQVVVSDGWTSSPFPKPLLPVSMEQSLSAFQESTSHKTPQPQRLLGYSLSPTEVESESNTKTSTLPSSSTPYQLTSSVLTCVQQESELLASLTKLLCGEPGEDAPARSPTEIKTKRDALAQTLPTSRRTDKGQSTALGKTFVETAKGRVMEPRRSLRIASPAGTDVVGKRRHVLQNKAETELPHSWYNVDILVEFEHFPWMQRFLELRIIPFSKFDRAPSEDEGLGTAGSVKVPFLKTLSRKQQPRPSQVSAREDLRVNRKVALLPTSHPELQRTCCEVFVHVLRRGRLSDALHLLWTEAFTGASMHPTMRGLKDLASRMAFLELAEPQKKQQRTSGSVSLRYNFPEAVEVMLRPVQLLRYMEDATTAAQLALSTLECWSVHANTEMLSYCVSRISPLSELHPVLQKHLERMKVYQQILHLVDPTSSSIKSARSVVSPLTSPFSFLGEEAEREHSPQWTSWQEVQTAAKEDPCSLLEAILTQSCFELARRWARIDSLDRSVHHEIEVRYLLTMLEREEVDTAMLCKTLDCSTTDKAEQLQVCEVVLSRLSSTTPVTATQPILQFMLSKLSDTLTAARLEDCKKRATGIKVLLSMPESARSPYQRLVGDPCLLMEQLLVDTKFEWAGCAVATLRSEGACVSSAVSKDGPFQEFLAHTDLAQDGLDEILMFYAMKAMELPPVPDIIPATPRSPPSRAPTPAPGTPVVTVPHKHRRSSSTQSQMEAGGFESSTVASSIDSWYPPHHVPKQRQWVSNGEAEKCMACKKVVFGTFNRRHHCRRCGEVVCAKCSNYSLPMEGYSSLQRACWRCYQYENRNHPVKSLVPPMLTFGSHDQWVLLPNEPVLNHKRRSEFYFEKSPNIDLFLSILEFHSSLASCAEFIIHQVEQISLSIISDSSGHVHRELDHTFVTTIMKQLLLTAKLKFSQCMDSVGVELCDTYLSRVDVLGILVSTRCKFTPSLQDLAKPDIARRVRDRLVQDDHFSLAMEVSTKCQVDISSVWAAWGMACLKTGNFKAAKEKFLTCFKMSTTKASSLQRVEVVNSIVTFLESNPLISTLAAEVHVTQYIPLSSAPNRITGEAWLRLDQYSLSHQSKGCWLDITRLQECHYYLQTYGTQLQYVQFLWRHGFLEAACKLIIDKGLPTDVFLEGLYVPCLKNGTIQKLEDLMLARDYSLHVWEPHLMAACRYFNSRSLFHILYHIQLFMKDYIRAAQTCIKFYTGLDGRKTKVIDLILRKEYLNCAIKHLEMALQPKQASREVSTSSAKKVASPEIQTWLDTIHLQLELIDFLDYQISAVSANVSLSVSQGPPIPHREQFPLTLFGSGQARAALACTAVLADPGLKDGFSLATKIILTFHLPTEDILCHMAKALVLAERYSDVKDLLVLVQSSEICPESSNDKIIISAVKVLSQQTKDVKHIDHLTLLLSDDRNKIQAYIQCGKLKSAYLIAVNRKMADEVRNISRVASQAGQVSIRDICDRWLQQSASGSDTERPGRPRTSRAVPTKRN